MKKTILILLTISLFACDESPKTGDNGSVQKVDSVDSPSASRGLTAEVSLDSLVVTVNAKGGVTIGDKVADFDKLEAQLVDTLQMMKKSYGKLPDTILYRSKGEVLMGVRGEVKDAILNAKAKVKKD